jgi:hypothetical protein
VKAQIQAAKRARKGIEGIRRKLLSPSPEAVNACAGPLMEAIGCLEIMQTELGFSPTRYGGVAGDFGQEIVRLQRELSQAKALLQSAAEFNEGQSRLLGSHQSAETGYSRIGAALPKPEGRSFIVHG